MSDHSKPRRWTLHSGTRDASNAFAKGELLYAPDGPVPVREDCITTEDVEAVAKALSEKAYCDIAPEQYFDEARSLLARIFEGGEQS